MEILLNAIIKAVGWSIIHSMWQGAILYTALLLLFISNPKLTAKSRHNLSFMALSGISLWFIITFYNEFTAWLYIGKSIETISAYPPAAIPVHYNMIKLPASLLYKAEQSIPWLVYIYSIGLLLQIVYLLCGYYRVWQIKTKGLTDIPADLNERFTDVISKIKIKRTILFKLSSKVSVPLVIGYFKPVVLLPLSLLAQMNQDQLEAIIIHELSHIRRNDYLLNLLKISIETIFFFNPFVWLCTKLIDTERENACDDLVLKVTGSPLSYARTLLQLEKIKSGQQVFSMAITGKKYHLLNRIKRITTMKTSNLNLKQQLFAIFLLATTALSIGWINVKKDESILYKSPKPDLETLKKSKAGIMQKAHSYIRPSIKSRFEIKTDTTKKKFKIVVTDEKGNIKEYNNINELPEDLRSEFMKQSIIPSFSQMDTSYLASLQKMYSSPEFKKQFEDANKMFENPKWEKQMESFQKQFDSPEWKTQMEDFQKQFDNPEWKKQMEGFQKQLDSPEWKKYFEDLQKKFDSPEWKKYNEDLQKQFDSPEWK